MYSIRFHSEKDINVNNSEEINFQGDAIPNREYKEVCIEIF